MGFWPCPTSTAITKQFMYLIWFTLGLAFLGKKNLNHTFHVQNINSTTWKKEVTMDRCLMGGMVVLLQFCCTARKWKSSYIDEMTVEQSIREIHWQNLAACLFRFLSLQHRPQRYSPSRTIHLEHLCFGTAITYTVWDF